MWALTQTKWHCIYKAALRERLFSVCMVWQWSVDGVIKNVRDIETKRDRKKERKKERKREWERKRCRKEEREIEREREKDRWGEREGELMAIMWSQKCNEIVSICCIATCVKTWHRNGTYMQQSVTAYAVKLMVLPWALPLLVQIPLHVWPFLPTGTYIYIYIHI